MNTSKKEVFIELQHENCYCGELTFGWGRE